MKNFILLAVTVALATPAFATHAYRDESCKSSTKSHSMIYDGDVGYENSYSLHKIGSKAGVKVWEKGEASDSKPNYFEIVRSKGISSKIIKADCSHSEDIEFESMIDTSQSVLKFTIAAADQSTVGMGDGTLMIMNCETKYSYPVSCKEQKAQEKAKAARRKAADDKAYFLATCPEKYLIYIDKAEGGAGVTCNCPSEKISYRYKSTGGKNQYCAE